ncbi:MAG TPA: Spy/CpxP family protein refolding chaperone [Acetobacteraceae bacterium]|nr:Spy/CpxP family protein refolding chaperone [Acetobacteraceae bacterium]
MRVTLRNTVIATTAIFGLSAFAAIAAPPGAGDPTTVHPMTHEHAAVAHRTARDVEQRIADLHAKLAISPAQKPQWDQFAQVMRDNARTMDQSFRQREQMMPTMTANENMASYAQVAMTHAQDMQKMVPAFQALYSVMSDNQKRMADQVFRADAHRGAPARHG